MDFSSILAVAKQFGPLASAIVFFLWRDYRREGRMADRIDQLENEMRNTVLPLVKQTTEVIASNTAVMTEIKTFLKLEHHRK